MNLLDFRRQTKNQLSYKDKDLYAVMICNLLGIINNDIVFVVLNTKRIKCMVIYRNYINFRF